MSSGWEIEQLESNPNASVVTLLVQMDPKQALPLQQFNVVFNNQAKILDNLKTIGA